MKSVESHNTPLFWADSASWAALNTADRKPEENRKQLFSHKALRPAADSESGVFVVVNKRVANIKDTS